MNLLGVLVSWWLFSLRASLCLGAEEATKKETDAKPAEEKKTTASRAAERRAAIFRSGPASMGAMALAFDDGPHPTLTPRLIEILKKSGATATFFMLGEQVEKLPEIARSVAEAGFEIGNHSFTHADLTKIGIEKVRSEIKRTQEAIEKATGMRPKLFRPPYGNVDDKVYQVAREEGLEIVTWSIDPRDWDMKKSGESVREKIVGDGAGGQIVCVHDIHARTVDMTEDVIAALKAKGLAFTTAGRIVEAEKQARLEKKSQAATGGDGGAPAQPALVPLSKTALKKP